MSEIDTQALKNTLIDLKSTPRDDSGCPTDMKHCEQIFDAMMDVGNMGLQSLRGEISAYLTDPCAAFREEAIKSLIFLHDEEFIKNQAYQFWLNDPSDDVKCAALTAWGTGYEKTKNAKVLQELYAILKSDHYSNIIRTCAFTQILQVAEAPDKPLKQLSEAIELRDLEGSDTFNKAVDWNRIDKIISELAPG